MSNKTIYDALVAAGMTREGACAMWGNWYAESNCEAYRLQGDFTKARTKSHDYVAAVTSGAISRQQFGSDQLGFGLAQWTYVNTARTMGRKFDLYDFWKSSGLPLDSEKMQVAFAVHELRTTYTAVWAVLTASHDLYQCAEIVCIKFENPQVKNVNARYQFAKQFYDELENSEIPNDSPAPAPSPALTQQRDVILLQLAMQEDGSWDKPIDGLNNAEWRQAFKTYAGIVLGVNIL